jgi:hypothetical protein
MPMKPEYYQQLIAKYAELDRQARRDTRRAWARVLGEIALWTGLGMACVFMAFRVLGVEVGRIWWLIGNIMWIGGVSAAVLSAYRRGEDRGDW